jgi:hypothetical protein
VAQFDGPVLVLHSPQDDLIPYAHGERLAAIAGKRGRLVTIAGDHNHGPSTTGEAYLRALRAHVDTVVGE